MDESVREFSEGETSDDGLKIAYESPKRKTPKNKVSSYDVPDKAIIGSVESDLDNILDEKASKSNLTTVNVKSILKEVVKNEHVIALVRRAEDPNTSAGSVFEPKLTRAKVKELFSTAPGQSHPLLITTTPPSEVQRLISNEFAEDSSGDEYIPAEESEDDPESSVVSESDVRSVSPVTPIKHFDSPICCTDDGIFKIPPVKTTEEKTEDATVALRTRSKLSLNDTSVEDIVGRFMPPDITPDMYEMECDNDLWSDFLRNFSMKPLDEVTKGTEDDDHDEHDPSYNILADEAINLVDTEDFRADKAVNISRKELNELIAGLCDYVNDDESKSEPRINLNVQPPVVVLEDVIGHQVDELQNLENNATASMSVIEPSCDVDLNEIFRSNQILLLKQQMRQHVQLLTQQFLLSYQHPEFNHLALEFKSYLLNLKFLATKEDSAFKTCNLEPASELISEWELQLNLNTDDVKKMKEHVARVTEESKQYHASGNEYIPKLSNLILETISKSIVFIYPHLLPKIPFKTSSILGKAAPFLPEEDQLIALGMEQFIPYLARDKFHLNKKGEVKLKSVCTMICEYMISTKNAEKLYHHIHNVKHPRNPMNPIRYYMENKKAPSTLHYVISIEEFGIVPPNKRDKNQLPYQFRQYLYPEPPEPRVVNSITKVVKPPAFNKRFTKSPSRTRRKLLEPLSCATNCGSSKVSTLKKPICSSTPKPVVAKKLEEYFQSPNLKRFNQVDKSCIKCLKFNSSIFKKITHSAMLPSMPNLVLSCNESVGDLSTLNSTQEDVSNITMTKDSTIVEVEDEVVEKEYEDGINALKAASSNIKNLVRKSISGAEKRKTKLRRQCTSTLTTLSVQDPTIIEEKEQKAYFDKAQERLAPEEYEQVLEIFNNFQEGKNSVVELYKNTEKILGKTHPDLMEEFLTFLTPGQAKEVGKLIPYYMLSNMSLFLRKLETYFEEQPSQLRKIYRSLIELTNCVNVTMDRVKTTILPLLKENNLLTDWFLQIFPTEPPPESLLQGLREQVNILRGVDTNQEDCLETITVSDVEDQYGGFACICSCHQTEDIKSRCQHCVPCRMKFLQGCGYVQTIKGLPSANITFDSNSGIDHNLRLNCSPDKKKRPADMSPSKQQISPPKEYQEEVQVKVDSEDDKCIRKKARPRSPRKKKVKLTDKNEKAVIEFIENQEGVTEAEISTDLKSCLNDLNDTIVPQTSADIMEKREEWEFNTSVESTELRASSERGTESESEFCEESFQETDESESESLSDSPIHSDNSNRNTFEHVSWNREEDRIILETLQKEGDREDTFLRISELLDGRTVSQIRERFNTLMTLLQKMKLLNK